MRAAFVASVVLAAASASAGCATLRTVTAGDDDLADYAAFRVAAYEGTRLARATVYLDAHPDGAWASEVHAAFDAEEPTYFERAQVSRARTSDYLASLPRGPHAAQALALLTAFDARVEDIETARLLREARRSEAKLARASNQRRELGERILADVAAILDPAVYGVRLDDAPPGLRRALGGVTSPTWGPLPARREEDVFFQVPTHLERESRFTTLLVAVTLERSRVVEGRVEGTDLFVRWSEADTMTPLDDHDPADRALAADHARDQLAGALEARLPEARCKVPPGGDALLERACDGWSLIVRAAKGPGGSDTIVVRGPAPRTGGPTVAK